MNFRIAQVLYRGFWTALDWMYPPNCVGCGEQGYRLCFKCQQEIKPISGPLCQRCGSPITAKENLCAECQSEEPPFEASRSLASYEGVIRECVHSLKYDRNQAMGEFFAEELTELIRREGWDLDLVVPVPLSPIRMKERGYNQATLLARPISYALGIPFTPFGLKRIRNTQSQVELSAKKRKSNVRGAFEATPEIVHGKRVLLIDDVTTTGSTLKECSLALKKGGSLKVYCLTLARPIQGLPPVLSDSPSSII
ncbi:ComF family protein [Chloroflexota bacterium]|nr:ComF family protein [Chloroflexota bacterium]